MFSKIIRSKKAAKHHKEKEKAKDAEPVKAVYKHVPTHAAFDALSGAPSSWSYGDRPKIKAQHKRRSQMVISRTESSLSTATMTYVKGGAHPHVPPFPRNSSYNSYNPTWFDRRGDLTNTSEKPESAAKRHKSSRGHSYHDSGIGPSVGPSPPASNLQSEGKFFPTLRQHPIILRSSVTRLEKLLTSDVEVSPIISSGNSTSSSNSYDNLEMPRNQSHMSLRPQPIVYADQDIFDKLHTSTTRKLGEAPLYDSPPVVMKTPVVAKTTASRQKQKKNRWSLMSKRSSTIAAI